MSFYFRQWAHSPSVSAMRMGRYAAVLPLIPFLQDPHPMAIPSRGLGHRAPAHCPLPPPAPHRPAPDNAMACCLGISRGKGL